MSIVLSSPAFAAGSPIPPRYTADGENVSPPLQWSEVPAGTQSLALLCDDPDAPGGNWVHWVLFNLPASLRELPAGVPATKTLDQGGRQGKNSFGHIGYGGPAPPRGKPHRYIFTLYALDRDFSLPGGIGKSPLVAALQGHILAEAQWLGTYQRT